MMLWLSSPAGSGTHWTAMTTKLRFAAVALGLLILAGSCDAPSGPGSGERISESALLDHLEYLAADNLFGRRGGSEHELAAAGYVRGQFIRLGLESAGDDYLQSFTFYSPADRRELMSQNVLAVLPGAGELAGQWIVVGAHYDHLGVDAGSGHVFNGADDNASGTALLIEVARVIRSRVEAGAEGGAGRRSIMFHAYGAEELGLRGSNHFCAQPTVAMDSVVAMVNFDMVGRLRANRLVLIGSSSSEDWMALVGRNNGPGLEFSLSEAGLDRSDQYCFYQRSRPVLFFHTGLHPEYHTPQDDVTLIDEAGMARIGDLVAALVLDVALRPVPPAFTGGGELPDDVGQ